MRVKTDRLEQLKKAGKAAVTARPEPVAAPTPPAETPVQPAGKKKWRFDVERNWDGYITNVVATEL